MHDAFDRIEEVPVPDGFAERIMGLVRETPQTAEKKIIPFPRWRRWAALAACCAIVALGLWSAQRREAMPQRASQSALAESAPSMARDAAIEEIITADDALVTLMMDEDGAVFHKDVPAAFSEKEPSSEEQKQSRNAFGSTSDSLPEVEEDVVETESDADYSRDGSGMPEPAMAVPLPAAGDREEPLSGIITASGEAVRAWVENELGLAWEPGRTYLLTEEEYAGLLSVLTAAEEEFQVEPEEGCWLLAE